jgi:hypothetical protein
MNQFNEPVLIEMIKFKLSDYQCLSGEEMREFIDGSIQGFIGVYTNVYLVKKCESLLMEASKVL